MTDVPVEAVYILARIRGMHDTVAHFSELRARGTYVTYGFITGTYVSCKIKPFWSLFCRFTHTSKKSRPGGGWETAYGGSRGGSLGMARHAFTLRKAL